MSSRRSTSIVNNRQPQPPSRQSQSSQQQQQQHNNNRRRVQEVEEEEEEEETNNNEEEEEDDEDYGEPHRLLVQQFIKRGVVSQSTLDKIVGVLNTKFKPPRTANQYINALNSRLMDMGFQIKTLHINGVNEYAFTNIIPDECSKFATLYEPVSLQFFNHIVKLFVDSKVGLKKNEILNLGKDSGLRLADTETKLEQFILDGWLRYSHSRSHITLSNRALMDLEPLLGELPKCTLCHSFCVLLEDESVECPNDDCAKMHSHCAETWLKAHRGECPTCKTKLQF